MKKLSQKSLTLCIFVLVLTAFVLVNLCLPRIQERYSTRLDLTDAQLYALDEETLAIAESLTVPVHVYVFSAENDYPAVFREMLLRCAQLSPNLTIQYVDPAENPVLISHFEKRGFQPKPGDLLAESSLRAKLIPYASLMVTQGDAVTGIDLEQQLDSAIVYFSSSYTPRAVFTTGHNERPTSQLTKLFTDSNYETRTLALSQQDAGQPELLIIAAPTADFTFEEITILRELLQAGTRLMIFLEPSETPLPHLEGLLSEWGMVPQHNLLSEPKAFAAGSPGNLIPMYASHPINAYFAENPLYVVSPSTSGITLANVSQAKASALLTTTGDCQTDAFPSGPVMLPAPAGEKGQHVIAALSGNQVFLCGSRMIYADDLMSTSSYANRMFLSRVLSALWEENISVTVPMKTLHQDLLPITNGQAGMIGLLLCVVLPAAVLIFGLIRMMKRRRSL